MTTHRRRLPCGCRVAWRGRSFLREYRCPEALALCDAQRERVRRLYRELTSADLEPERRLLRQHLHRRPRVRRRLTAPEQYGD